VYMACRSMERARVAADEIKQRAGVDDSQLVVMQLDLSSLSSVRGFVNSFKTSNYLSLLSYSKCQAIGQSLAFWPTFVAMCAIAFLTSLLK